MTAPSEWEAANKAYLSARLALVRQHLAALCDPASAGQDHASDPWHTAALEEAAARAAPSARPAALDQLCAAFSLSQFERDILLLCAAMELDAGFARLCAEALRDPRVPYPTFHLALTTLPGAHWSATTPVGPLRRWRLVEMGAGETMMTSPLRIDERVLHHLVGASYVDPRLRDLLDPVPMPAFMPASYRLLAERIIAVWSAPDCERPIVHLTGEARGSKRGLAATACAALGLRLHALHASDIPATAAERAVFVRLLEREAVLHPAAVLLDGEDSDPSATRQAQLLTEDFDGLLIVVGNGAPDASASAVLRLEVPRPTSEQQRALWTTALGPAAERLNGGLDAVVSQFHLDTDGIQATAATARRLAAGDEETIGPVLWDLCRSHARMALSSLAERLEPRARWMDLVLPDEQLQTLREMAAHVRGRLTVYESWGFAEHVSRGLGITALFAGPSGTGKTLAAEVLAGADGLRLDLFRIDLSQVTSKYIGETEKNLRRVFDAAEHSGAVLLFDEADALFGKRSEVHDSHDRYANIEISYLLQRMESYRGLAILTTNRRNALDTAFLRRFRFVIPFPFPDAAHRARIWERAFPPRTPTDGIDIRKLARLNVTGGHIRNIALNAAFLAADLGEPVRMTHLLHTARSECAKLEKPLTTAEIGGWV
ncbi:MAG: ATP-binding protein [Candidatus Polarisedimenticolia bacterium]